MRFQKEMSRLEKDFSEKQEGKNYEKEKERKNNIKGKDEVLPF